MPKVAENLTKEQRLAGWKRLTDKQQDFLNNFMHKDMTQTSAARLLRNPVVQERYQEMREEARSRFGVTIDKSVRDLLKMRNEAWESGKFGEAIRAEELRLKATGLLVNKAHVLHERTDSMTREEILAKLQEFQDIAQKRMKVATTTHKDPDLIEQSSVKPIN